MRRAPCAVAVLIAATISFASPRTPGVPVSAQRASPEAAPATVAAIGLHTVILVRHAEKAAAAGNDPELSPAGTRRAERLADLLAKGGVTRLVASEFQRTRATLAPLSRRLGIDVETRPAKDPTRLVQELLSAAAGSVTVVAGHSNTVPGLAKLLGTPLADVDPEKPELPDGEYDRLLVLTLPATGAGVRPSCVELRYGDT